MYLNMCLQQRLARQLTLYCPDIDGCLLTKGNQSTDAMPLLTTQEPDQFISA